NPDPFLGKWEEGGINFSMQGNYIFKNHFLLEGVISRYDAHRKAEPATERGLTEPLFMDNTTGIWSGGYCCRNDHHSIRTSGSLTGTQFLGNHVLKAGFQYENNELDEYWVWHTDTAPDNAGAIVKNADNFYVTLPLDFQPTVRNRVYSLFTQTTLAFASRFRLHAGLRWDGQYFKGLQSKRESSITGQFQPRLGFTYQLGELGSQKISGSYGRFYEQIPNQPLSFVFGPNEQERFSYDHDPREDPSGGRVFKVEAVVPTDLKGQHFDEFILGYERQIDRHFKAGIRGIYRTIREIIELGFEPESGLGVMGNPGRGALSFAPEAKREYKGLELTVEKSRGGKLNFFASYVLSRNSGNYTGLFASDTGQPIPHQTLVSRESETSAGLLPNDRTHVFKFNGSYNLISGLTSGVSFIWQTGTPLSEFGRLSGQPGLNRIHLRPRGTVWRTPAIWDLNLRFTYNLNKLLRSRFQQKLILDIFHLFSQRKPVHLEQHHFLAVNPQTGEQILENPNYLEPLLYQPPMTVRLGLEVGF
ncbi:TonB-dependent receptor, partial [bacterium]|nr:TonB-dependent receptor [bacterium]